MEFEEFYNPMRGARKTSSRAAVKGIQMDMNAMVDIAFLLLTFFMLTTTMVKPKAIEMVMPAQDKMEETVLTQTIRESRAVTLIALPDDQLVYYRGFSDAKAAMVAYGAAGIRKLLKEIALEIEDPIVLIKPHPESVFENLVNLLDEVNISGIERYTIDAFGAADRKILEAAGFIVQ